MTSESVDIPQALEYFDNQGKTTLPDRHRQVILLIFEKFPDRWLTTEDFKKGLKMSRAYAYKVCESLTIAKIVERTKVGKTAYYRYNPKIPRSTS